MSTSKRSFISCLLSVSGSLYAECTLHYFETKVTPLKIENKGRPYFVYPNKEVFIRSQTFPTTQGQNLCKSFVKDMNVNFRDYVTIRWEYKTNPSGETIERGTLHTGSFEFDFLGRANPPWNSCVMSTRSSSKNKPLKYQKHLHRNQMAMVGVPTYTKETCQRSAQEYSNEKQLGVQWDTYHFEGDDWIIDSGIVRPFTTNDSD